MSISFLRFLAKNYYAFRSRSHSRATSFTTASQLRPDAQHCASGLERYTELAHGEILTAQGTAPGWTPTFPLIGELILETGGLLSHGAMSAREYGSPAVIHVPGVLNLIQNGQTIELDGTNGRIYFDQTGKDR